MECSEPNCPVCGKPLHMGAQVNCDGHNVPIYWCSNVECEKTENLLGTREMWEHVKFTNFEAMYGSSIAEVLFDPVFKTLFKKGLPDE